ncbi:MAG: ABC transporter permease [Deltaproteobacteria bacterium]|nr:ABC transporter permease [Deltaproteobacteria bacterium]
MKLTSVIELTKCRWREFRREPSAFLFVLAMPLFWMLILGFAFSEDAFEHYKIGMLAGKTELSHQMESLLAHQKGLELVVGDEESLVSLLHRNEIPLFLKTEGHGLSLTLNGTHPDGEKARRLVDETLQTFFGHVETIPMRVERLHLPHARYIDFLIPGLLALSLFSTSLFGTGMVLVSSRRENLLKRFAATPMGSLDYIVSHILGRYLIFVLEFLVVLLGGSLLFSFRVEGSFLSYLLVSIFGVATFTSLGILCGSRARNTGAYNGLVNLLLLSTMMLSGIWFPRHHFPLWMQRLSEGLPLTALVDALRAIAIEGAGLTSQIPQLIILATYTVVCTVSAKILFRWY